MTQKDKDLLLKDLSARLPYEVKVQVFNHGVESVETLYQIDLDGYISTLECDELKYSYKPYLFPLSSMTEELKNFIRWKLTTPKYDSFDEESLEDLLNNNIQVVHFCYEHRLDINGLIEKDLAIDATGKNIY
jgi:hypothetical protein